MGPEKRRRVTDKICDQTRKRKADEVVSWFEYDFARGPYKFRRLDSFNAQVNDAGAFV